MSWCRLVEGARADDFDIREAASGTRVAISMIMGYSREGVTALYVVRGYSCSLFVAVVIAVRMLCLVNTNYELTTKLFHVDEHALIFRLSNILREIGV